MDPASLTAAFERAGYRLTEPRRAVASLIAEHEGHFTAADLVAHARARRLGLGRATVFRSLDVLVELDAIERIDLPSGEHAYVVCEPLHHHHVVCSRCGNVETRDPCGLCTDPRRDDSLIVVVADIADLWALERSGAVSGRYHVLGGVLSALDGVRPEHLTLDALVARASEPAVKEVILALNATVDGQTTAHFITDLLTHLPVKVTKLAHGVPVGGELDYLDDGTLVAAIRQRTGF